MAFLCPRCGAPHLELQHGLELPGDSEWDEKIALQLSACAACHFVGLCVYSVNRHGRGGRVHDHTGYSISQPLAVRVMGQLLLCPDPKNPLCGCPTHRELGETDGSGRWAWLHRHGLAESFTLRHA